MKKLFFQIFLFYSIHFFCSCKKVEKKQDVFSFKKFYSKDSIVFQEFLNLDSSLLAESFFMTDTSLITVNRNKLVKNSLFYEYSLKSKKLIGKYIKWGTKKGMVYGPMSVGLYSKEKLWVHDLSLNKVIVASLKHKISFDSIADLEEFKINGFAYSTQLMDSSRLLKSGIYTVPEYLQITDLKEQKTIRAIGEFIPPNNSFSTTTWKAAYESFLFLKPNEDSAVLACRYTDRVILFNLKTGKYKIVIGPYRFEPEFEPIKGLAFPVSRTSKTRFAFIDGAVTNHYIYLLFSGLKEKENNAYLSKQVFVYNWSGKPIKILSLDRFVSAIFISNNDEELFASDPNLNKIVISKIKI